MKNEKKKKGGKFPPKGDTTQKRRQSRRREKLNEIAKAHGFASWSAYETAVINGMARLTKRAADGANCPPNSKVSRHAPPLTQTVSPHLAKGSHEHKRKYLLQTPVAYLRRNE